MSAHARIAPSSLALTVACNASVQLQESVPALPLTDEEAEGNAGHLVARWAAQSRLLNIGEKFHSDGRDWEVTIDMHNGARTYMQALGGQHNTLRIEDPVRASTIHSEHCWGTPDAWRFFSIGDEYAPIFSEPGPPAYVVERRVTRKVLRVADYKYGFRYVEAFENYQLVAYAVGVLERLNVHDLDVILELVIVQPRYYGIEGQVRVWRVNGYDIRALVNTAFNEAHAALGPNPIARTGEHCIDCKARHVCGTLRKTDARIVDYSGMAELAPLDAMAMGHELRILDAAMKRLEARRTGLAVAAETALRAGQLVPFYEMAPKRSNMQWDPTLTPEHIATIGDLLGVEIRKPLDVFTPRQAIEAGIDEAVISQYASRPPAGMTMKPSSPIAMKKALST